MHADALRAFRDLLEAARRTRDLALTATRTRVRGGVRHEIRRRQGATSALRLASRLPADAAFFRAGALCRAAGDTNSAFVFLNRFLDIADAVDDAAEASFDSVSPSPRNSSLKALRRVCEPWTTTTSARRTFPARASHPALGARRGREVARGGEGLGADSLHGPRGDAAAPRARVREVRGVNLRRRFKVLCGAESERCAVTGWPVPPGERVDAGGGRGAKRADWDAWANVVGTDPWDPAGKAATVARL